MSSKETFRPVVEPYPGPLPSSRAPTPLGDIFNNCNVSYGLPFTVTCAKHAEETFHAKRVFIIASATLANTTSALDDFSDIFAIAEECRKQNVDLIVTLGGGSLTDAAKMVSLVSHISSMVDMRTRFTRRIFPGSCQRCDRAVPVVCIPTTLSAGEYTLGAGVTDDRDNKKHQFIFPKAIHLVIFDPALLTAHTPTSVLLQSGFRSVDHCVESFCSLYANEATETYATRALKQLVPALLRCKADADARVDVEARLLCQLATLDAIAAPMLVYTPVGASHAIGHMLGPFGVGHGHTSCILLPATCKYNARHGANVDRQKTLADMFWGIPEMRKLAESQGLKEGAAELGDLLSVLVSGLGMPRTLAEVGVGRDLLDQLAEYSLLDPWCATNPVPLKEKSQVMEILEAVAE